MKPSPIRGRGAAGNPANRFESQAYEPLPASGEASPETVLLRDSARSILSYNESPDVGFEVSLNPYRGCEHGCIYCFARPNHEYLGFSAGLDFETRILVKEDAPDLLRRELLSRKWTPQPIALSGVTDAFQPIERSLRITRRCLEVLAEFRNPVIVITKNELVTRDADLLSELARYHAALVYVSVTSLDGDLIRDLEPRASHPLRRLAAIRSLTEAGVPTGVLAAPVIPGLTDHEMPAILSAAAAAGAVAAGFVPLRLPYGVSELFEDWLGRHRPLAKEKILGRIRDLRSGRLNDPQFGSRMRGSGPYADHLRSLFQLSCRKAGLPAQKPSLSADSFKRPGSAQMSLF